MMLINLHERILTQKLGMAQLVTSLHFQLHPELYIPYKTEGREKCIQDLTSHLTNLAKAVWFGSITSFKAYIEWAQVFFESRNMPPKFLSDYLFSINEVFKQVFDEDDYKIILSYLEDVQNDYRPAGVIEGGQAKWRAGFDRYERSSGISEAKYL